MRLFLMGVVGGMVLSMGINEAEELPAQTLLREVRPLVIAHRGYSGIAPENTVAAFRLGMAAGADLIELDYHHTQDRVPVVIHDGTLDRTTNATNLWGGQKLAVANHPMDRLRELDAGAWFGPRWTGERVLTLEEALAVIQAGGVTLVERKAGDAGTLVQLLQRGGWINRLVVQSFDWEFLRQVHELEPRQILGALGPPSRLANGREPRGMEKPLSDAWLDELASTGARVAVWNREVGRDSVQSAHRRGLKVWVYTINEPALAEALLEMGVDGLITDHVSLIWRASALRNVDRGEHH